MHFKKSYWFYFCFPFLAFLADVPVAWDPTGVPAVSVADDLMNLYEFYFSLGIIFAWVFCERYVSSYLPLLWPGRLVSAAWHRYQVLNDILEPRQGDSAEQMTCGYLRGSIKPLGYQLVIDIGSRAIITRPPPPPLNPSSLPSLASSSVRARANSIGQLETRMRNLNMSQQKLFSKCFLIPHSATLEYYATCATPAVVLRSCGFNKGNSCIKLHHFHRCICYHHWPVT